MAQYKSIFSAIVCNDIEAVKTFLPECLEEIDSNGMTPLMYACSQSRRIEIVRLLLDYGANIEARDKYSWTSLHWACRKNNIDNVNLLLDRNADIETKDKHGLTPLYITCVFGIHDISELLVSRGADPFVISDNGKSAIDCDNKTINESGDTIIHSQILIRLRAEYLNKRVLQSSDATTVTITSGWEMEM